MSSCHKLWTSFNCISSGKILQKVSFFWRIFLKLCSLVFSFLLRISFFKSGIVSCFEKRNILSFRQFSRQSRFFDLAGVLPLLFRFSFPPHLFPACPETALHRWALEYTIQGKLMEMRTIEDKKLVKNYAML